jgi:hypothetical protein
MNSFILLFLISCTSFFSSFGMMGLIPFDLYGVFALFVFISRGRINFKYLIGLIVSAFLVLLTSLRFSGDDIIPYARIVLMLLDGAGVYLAFKEKFGRNVYLAANLILIIFGAYLICFVLWWMIPDKNLFFFSDIKGWVASFPMLLFMYLFLKKKAFLAHMALVFLLFIAMSYASRTLLLCSILCLFFLLFKFNYRQVMLIFTSSILLAMVIGAPILSVAVLSTDDLSTIYRYYMTAALANYEFDSLITGIGVSRWHTDISSFLSWTPNANEFFEKRANPHFLPTEIVIYGGFVSLGIFLYILHHCFRNSVMAPFLVAFIFSSFFTTNTGIERVFVSITLFLALWSSNFPKQSGKNRYHRSSYLSPPTRITQVL